MEAGVADQTSGDDQLSSVPTAAVVPEVVEGRHVREVVEKVIRVLREPGVALGMSVAGGINSMMLPDTDSHDQVSLGLFLPPSCSSSPPLPSVYIAVVISVGFDLVFSVTVQENRAVKRVSKMADLCRSV